MVTGTGVGLEVTLFPLLFISTEKATDMNDTEWWAQASLMIEEPEAKIKSYLQLQEEEILLQQ